MFIRPTPRPGRGRGIFRVFRLLYLVAWAFFFVLMLVLPVPLALFKPQIPKPPRRNLPAEVCRKN